MIIAMILLSFSLLFAIPLFFAKKLSFLWILISLGLLVAYLFVCYFFSIGLIYLIVGLGYLSLYLFLLAIKKGKS